MPKRDVEGGGGKPHEWLWSNLSVPPRQRRRQVIGHFWTAAFASVLHVISQSPTQDGGPRRLQRRLRELIFTSEQSPPKGVRDRLVAVLTDLPGIEVVGHAAGPRETLEAMAGVEADLVLLDLRLAGGSGLHVLKE